MNNSLVVYQESWIVSRIYQVSDEMRTKISDQTKFEERCIGKVAEYIKGDRNRLKHRRHIEWIIQREAHDYLSWAKREHANLFVDLTIEEDQDYGEEEIEFEPEDVLANVLSDVLTKETTDLLAQGDRIKKEIVGHWAIGNSNVASISRMLAHSFGGNEESHRKSITRFRRNCRQVLSAV